MLEILCLCQQRPTSDIEMLMSLPMGHLTIMCIITGPENLELPETFRSAQSLLLMWFTQLLVCQSGSAVHLPNSSSVWTKFCPFTAASVNWTVCQIRGPTTVASSLSLGLGLICYQCRDSCIPIGFPSFGFPKLFKLLALFEPWVAI